MGFPNPIREKALLLSARRCCVCRQFKGLYIEVHHITPQAAGGTDTLENAIALCFDCHASAGHYNSDHPKGTKYSPTELRGHREKHYADVAAGRFPASTNTAIKGLHVRRLVCLSYEQARSMLKGTLQGEFLNFGLLIQTPVSKFMEVVLADELPEAQDPITRSGTARPGLVSMDAFWSTRDELVAVLPEFRQVDERAVESRDFHGGALRSKLLFECVKAGLPPAELGVLSIHHNFCGGETWSVQYKVRRPVFVFTLIDNFGTNTVTVANVVGGEHSPVGLDPRRAVFPSSGKDHLETSTIILQPGHSMAVPTAVLLSPSAEDDLSFEWLEKANSGDRVDYTAYSNEEGRLGSEAYLAVGPSFVVTSVQVLDESGLESFEAPSFDLRRVYLLGQALMAGSCPHAVVELADGKFVYLGEILTDAWKRTMSQILLMPPDARFLHVCEFEFETTTVQSIKVGQRIAVSDVTILNRGDVLSVVVDDLDVVEIVGQYDCAIGHPMTGEQHRLKRSLVLGGLRAFVKRQVSASDAIDRELSTIGTSL